MSAKNLYIVLSAYRSPNKNFIKGDEKFMNFKKGTFVWGVEHNMANGKPTSVLIIDKFIIPIGVLRLASDEERAWAMQNAKEHKSSAEGENKPSVNNLNEIGKAAVAESMDKVSKLSLSSINSKISSHVSTGVMLGAIVGIGISAFAKKGFIFSVIIVVATAAAGGIIGKQIELKTKKTDE